MNSLLIGGAQNVGKSETIYKIANNLVGKGFIAIAGSIPPAFDDFTVVLKGFDKKGQKVNVIITSATDTTDIIKNFKKFFDENGNYDILISSVRDDDFYPRKQFFDIMGINPNDKNLVEIPFAKITRRGGNFAVALNWYSEKTEKLIIHTLNNNPFNI
ncbi:hypothetical protein QWY81_18145 [Polaribacter undariae]|uniref:Uncharacterized protein n=1 Tax=Polaribacter sejongensis TaxID=985043 RepID=A0AAJ1R337_9FLAO|nr:hypothetical protein [Polaribacter undariae]MDN3621391.1 hypothetical protein [Polaribacter undariae]UWD31826.1 hypothetical protein NQP51_17055 [Polaribacter undariae]